MSMLSFFGVLTLAYLIGSVPFGLLLVHGPPTFLRPVLGAETTSPFIAAVAFVLSAPIAPFFPFVFGLAQFIALAALRLVMMAVAHLITERFLP